MYKSIETLLVSIPTIRPHKMAVATMHTQTLVLVKITANDGFIGWGEATTIGGLGYGEESLKVSRLILIAILLLS